MALLRLFAMMLTVRVLHEKTGHTMLRNARGARAAPTTAEILRKYIFLFQN
jgi:hypothetical protein